MTDSEILARWQGWKNYKDTWSAPDTLLPKNVPDYPNDDAAAMSLLDTLVEKGFDARLQSFLEDPVSDRWQCTIWQNLDEVKGFTDWCVSDVFKPTRREAIIAACLEVARKEMEG